MASPARIESNKLLRRWCAPIEGHVLSIGSAGDSDHQGRFYRDYFEAAESYTTSEVDGDGCDRKLDVCKAKKSDGPYEAIFCSGVLEHVLDPIAAVKGMKAMLAPGGVLLLGIPFNQGIHHAPTDYWRWTEFGIRVLLEKHRFEIDELVPIGDAMNVQRGHPETYWIRCHVP